MKFTKTIKRCTALGISAVLAASSFSVTALAAGLGDPAMIDNYAHSSSYSGTLTASKYYSAITAARNGMLNCSSAIDLRSYAVPTSAAGAFFSATLAVCPELFFVQGQFSYSSTYVNGQSVINTLVPYYSGTKAEITTQLNEFYDRADFFLNQINDELSACRDDFSKAALLHDEIALESHYLIPDSTNYTLMVNNFGKCENYSRVYAYLLGQVGIKSEIIDSDEMVHEWIKVKLDGKYYHVDLTWDDPTKDKPELVQHKYFLFSDSGFPSDHYDYSYVNASDSTKYDNYALHSFNTKLCKVNAGDTIVYAINPETEKLIKYNYSNNTSTTALDLSGSRWSAGSGGYWVGSFSGLDMFDGILYYNTPDAIMSYDPSTGKTATVASNSYSDSFYGVRIREDKLYGITSTDPNTTGTSHYIKTLTKSPTAVTSVSLNQSALKLTTGSTATLTATVLPSDASNKTVTWSTSNSSVATVSGGKVTAVAPGTATITAASVNGKTATCTVTVTDPVVTVTGISLDKSSLNLKTGETSTLAATISPSNATNKTVYWSTSNSSVATVSGGKVTAVAPGTATITAASVNGKLANCTVTVTDPVIAVTGVTLDKTSLSLTTGDTSTLTATISPSDATNKTVYWSTSNSSVATVSGGKVTAVAPGTAKITATSSNGKTAFCTVTVNAPLVNNSTLSADTVFTDTAVTITGAASGGKAPYKYAFYYKRSTNSKWNALGTEFGTATSAVFTPTAATTFDIKVSVKDSAGVKTNKIMTLTAKENQSFFNSSFINTDIAQIGDDIRITGAAEGGTGSYTYAFYFKRSTNSKWNKIGTEFGQKNYGVLIPSAAATYDMKATIKDESGAMVTKTFQVKVVESLPLTNISTINYENVNVGKTVCIYGRAIGGTKPFTFSYYFKRSTNSKWNPISYANESGSFAKFTATAATTYNIKVVVKDSTGTATSQKTFNLTAK